MDFLLNIDTWLSLLTLIFLEVVLGIDNVIFISIFVNKIPEKWRNFITNLGLLLAMVQRIILLFFISFLVGLKEPFYHFNTSFLEFHLNGQSIILFFGGIFLLYKSVTELYEKVENKQHKEAQLLAAKETKSLTVAVLQILFIDFIFSIDSILTAIGMVQNMKTQGYSLILMSTAVIVSILIMITFTNRLRKFIDRHPSIQLLGINFLLLIGVLLVSEGLHYAHASVFGNEIPSIPKEYLYFAIIFSLFIEFMNIRHRKNTNVKQN